jgi:hypothetical protein
MKEEAAKKLSGYRFAIMIAGAVILTIILTSISITIYISSGAINIDLSRPGYESVREETTIEESEPPFDATGPIDKTVADDLNRRLEKIQAHLLEMNSFSGETLSDEALDLAI